MGKQLTINQIKDLYESVTDKGNRFYFSPGTLRYFGQTLRSFKVRKIDEENFLIYAPSYWYIDGKKTLMGISQRMFSTVDNDLHDVPEEHKI